tara:strand:+ start:136 stop:393 length:258 start_codon:yes stop_codon:yes gene_type:complete
MQLHTYYYNVNKSNIFELTTNGKILQWPTDLQFFIEHLKLKYNVFIQIYPTKNQNIIKADIEIDRDGLYSIIEFKLRNYIKKHYI